MRTEGVAFLFVLFQLVPNGYGSSLEQDSRGHRISRGGHHPPASGPGGYLREPRKSYVMRIVEEEKFNEPPPKGGDQGQPSVLVRSEDDDETKVQRGRSVTTRGSPGGHNWYVYKGRGRSMGGTGPDREGPGALRPPGSGKPSGGTGPDREGPGPLRPPGAGKPTGGTGPDREGPGPLRPPGAGKPTGGTGPDREGPGPLRPPGGGKPSGGTGPDREGPGPLRPPGAGKPTGGTGPDREGPGPLRPPGPGKPSGGTGPDREGPGPLRPPGPGKPSGGTGPDREGPGPLRPPGPGKPSGGTGPNREAPNSTCAGSRRHGPYCVRRAKPRELVDPTGYNFFQFQPNSKIGFLWISGNRSGDDMSLNLGDDNGADEDDLDPANQYDWEFRRYDRACLYVEFKKAKAEALLPTIPAETEKLVQTQNEMLARRFLTWTFDTDENETAIGVDVNDTTVNQYTNLFLQTTKEIFVNKICKNSSAYAFASATSASSAAAKVAMESTFVAGNSTEFLPDGFVNHLFKLFMVMRDMTAPKSIPEYPTIHDKTMILDDILKNCSDSAENIHWFTHSCGDQVLSYGQKNNYACTPMHQYDFNTRLYDPVLDAVWHMFNAVHAYCFDYFQVNPRLWHRYSLIMANTFTAQMRQRWKASSAPEKYYTRLLGPYHEVHLETINRCTYGAALRSDVPILLPRMDTPSLLTFAPMGTMVEGGNSTATPPAPAGP